MMPLNLSWTSKRCIVSEEKAKEIKRQQPKYNVNMLAILWELIYPFPDVTNVFSFICKGQSETVEFVKHWSGVSDANCPLL